MSAGTKKVVNIEGHRTKADLKARAEADKAAERKNSLALEPPVWIKDMPEVQAIWDDLVRKMEGIELLDGLDADMLAEYCNCVATLRKLTKRMVDKDELYPDEVIKERQAELRIMVSLSKELGVSPGSRARLAQKRAAGELDKFAEAFGG